MNYAADLRCCGDLSRVICDARRCGARNRKSLPREEVRQAFRKEPNSDWEEECRCSYKRPLGGGAGRLKHEALREEVHRFVTYGFTPCVADRQHLCCSAAMRLPQSFRGNRLDYSHRLPNRASTAGVWLTDLPRAMGRLRPRRNGLSSNLPFQAPASIFSRESRLSGAPAANSFGFHSCETNKLAADSSAIRRKGQYSR